MYESKNKNESSNRITGEVMMFFGTTAPTGWLIMDGTEYLKSDYPDLATHLASIDESLSRTDYSGSDNDHFKVPNVLGEFPRFTGTNGHTNQGSGASVGVHQDATEINPYYYSYSGNIFQIYAATETGYPSSINKFDKGYKKGNGNKLEYPNATKASYSSISVDTASTRPTNTSFLPCIKY